MSDYIVLSNGEKARQVPGFPHYCVDVDGSVYSTRNGNLVELKLHRGRYYRFYEGHNDIQVSREKLEYCLENNVSPSTLSTCKVSVKRGDCSLELIDTASLRIERKNALYGKCSSDNLSMFRENLSWISLLHCYYFEDKNASILLYNYLEGLRPKLERFVRFSMHLSLSSRVNYLCDEVTHETLERVLSGRYLVYCPLGYMQRLARKLDKVYFVSGKLVAREDGLYLVKRK